MTKIKTQTLRERLDAAEERAQIEELVEIESQIATLTAKAREIQMRPDVTKKLKWVAVLRHQRLALIKSNRVFATDEMVANVAYVVQGEQVADELEKEGYGFGNWKEF